MKHMKKIIIAGAITLSFFSFYKAKPITHTNKTFMSVPTPHYYLPTKYSSLHRILKQGSSAENPWCGTLQAAPFFRMSSNATGLGQYFGTNYKNDIVIGEIGPEPEILIDLQADLLVHNYLNTSRTALKGTINLSPKHTVYGAYISYHQDLTNISDGLFLEINAPFVHVENDPRMKVANSTPDTNGSIVDFFAGKFVNADASDKQEALTHAKIDGIRSRSGVADIEFVVGYKLSDEVDHTMNGAIKIIAPTGSKVDGCYMFPAIVGNGRHWEVGAKFDGSLNISKSTEHSLECLFHVEYTYLFESDEKRTLGYRQPAHTSYPDLGSPYDDVDSYRYITTASTPWHYYVLGGQEGKAGVFPLANVLTRDLSVQPGSKLQGHLSFAYHRNNTTIDFGYSAFGQEGEKIKIKGCTCWQDDQYAVAHPHYQTNANFSVIKHHFSAANGGSSIGGPIQNSLLDLTVPATPAALKHSVHAAMSYSISEWDNPLVMGCGASVDWSQDNATPTGYTLWAKIGATF